MRYAALLRSVNVGGRSLAMAQLRDTVADRGFSGVSTYIQRGNLVFDTPTRSASRVATQLEEVIHDAFGLEVPVLVRTHRELVALVDANPFVRRAKDRKWLHTTFLARTPPATKTRSLDPERFAPDVFARHGREIYVMCPGGYGRTKLNNTYFERLLGVTATTRNWNTVERLVELTAP